VISVAALVLLYSRRRPSLSEAPRG
jgi:hypothetical protein